MTKTANKLANTALKLAPEDTAGLVRPQGRPKGSRNRIGREIRDLAQKYTLRAVRAAWKLAKGADSQDTQLKAIQMLLAYAHGRPVDRQELSGKDGAPLLTPGETHREQLSHALRVAHILKQGEVAADAIAAEEAAEAKATEGRCGEEPRADRHGAGDEGAGVSSGSPPSSSPPRKNGAADSAEATRGGPLSDRGGSGSHEDPAFSPENISENSKSKKPAPVPPQLNEDAHFDSFIVRVREPSRDGLPLNYSIFSVNGALLSGASDGWPGVLKWIKRRSPDDADLTWVVRKPLRGDGSVSPAIRPDQFQVDAPAAPEVFNSYGDRKTR